MWVFIFCGTLSVTFLIVRRNKRNMITMYIGLHVKYSSFLSDFNETRIFSTDFRKNAQISDIMKLHSVGAEFFHADRRTDFFDVLLTVHLSLILALNQLNAQNLLL